MNFQSLVLIAIAIPNIGYGHHSRAAYDIDTVTVLEGTLVGVRWRNPHIVFTLEVTGSDDSSVSWRMEAGSIYMLKRSGLSKELFESGATVQVAGHRSIERENDFLANSVLLSDGREVLTMPGAAPHWSDERLGGRDQWQSDNEILASRDSNDSGLFQVWSIPKDRIGTREVPLNPAAIAARTNWDMNDNLLTQCQQPGLPRIMLNPHPFQFIDDVGKITLLGEEFDMVRTIFLDSSQAPSDPEPSNLGLSIGSWDGQILEIHTSQINWPYFDSIGTPQSENVEVLEQYTLADGGRRLNYRIEVVDAEILDGPAVYTGHWLALGESIEPFECTVY